MSDAELVSRLRDLLYHDEIEFVRNRVSGALRQLRDDMEDEELESSIDRILAEARAKWHLLPLPSESNAE